MSSYIRSPYKEAGISSHDILGNSTREDERRARSLSNAKYQAKIKSRAKREKKKELCWADKMFGEPDAVTGKRTPFGFDVGQGGKM